MTDDADLNRHAVRQQSSSLACAHFNALLHRHHVTVRFESRVDDGWLGVLDALFDDLRAAGWDGSVSSIRERGGGLQIHRDGQLKSPAMSVLVGNAVKRAAITCALCGRAGSTHTGYYAPTPLDGRAPDGRRERRPWVKTLCDACAPLFAARCAIGVRRVVWSGRAPAKGHDP